MMLLIGLCCLVMALAIRRGHVLRRIYLCEIVCVAVSVSSASADHHHHHRLHLLCLSFGYLISGGISTVQSALSTNRQQQQVVTAA
jgi:arginine exporter protein ArgO